MTASAYGLQYTNDAGEWLINQDTVTPMFVTKGSFGSGSDNGVTPGGLHLYTHPVSYTNTFSGEVLTFMTLPSSAGAYQYFFDGSQLCVYAASAGYTLPELYVFTLTSHATPSGSYGLQIYKPDGSLAYDSRLAPMALHSIASGGSYSNTAETSMSLGTPPAKPAFLLPYYAWEQWTRQGLTSTSDVAVHYGTARRNGSTLYLNTAYDRDEVIGAALTGTYTYGPTTGIVVPMINAALYD